MKDKQTFDNSIEPIINCIRDERHEEAIELADLILLQLKKSGDENLVFVYEARFWKATALWKRGKFKAAFHGFSDVITLAETHGEQVIRNPDQIAFSYMACAESGSKITIDQELVMTIIDAGVRFCQRFDKADHRLMLEHLRSKVLQNFDQVEKAFVVAEQALASKRMKTDQEFGCDTSCFIKVYVELLAASGSMKEALQIVDQSLASNPHKDKLWSVRASLNLLQGEFSNACVDMDRAVPLRDESNYLVQRGLAKYLAFGPEACTEDLSKAFSKDDNSAEKALWCYLLGQNDVPLENFKRHTDRYDTALVNLAQYPDTASELINIAKEQECRHYALCQAHGFIAIQAEQNQNQPKAHEHYQLCLATGQRNEMMYLWAQVRLAFTNTK